MRADAIVRLLVAVNVPYDEIEVGPEWVNCKCPMAPWMHKGGADTRPSFGIRISDDGPSYYYCFGCTPEGRRVDWLLHNLYVMAGEYPWDAGAIYATEEIHERDEEDVVRVRDVWQRPSSPSPNPLPPDVIRQYKLLQGGTGFEPRRIREWLEQDRHIPLWAALSARVRYNPHNRSIIFPLTDRQGHIYLMRERSRIEKNIWTVSPKIAGFPNLVFPRLKHCGVWFNLHAIDWRLPVMAVEAELDVCRLIGLGFPNVIASATSSVTAAQIDMLLTARTLILGYDADRAGRHAHKRIKERAGKKANILEADWSIAKPHPDLVHEDRASDCKDAGELRDRDELLKVLANLK